METFNPIITVTLKQHSPMLHFQYLEKNLKPPVNPSDFPPGHAGACLRPSEVKPKLDKFLLRRFRKENGKNSEFEKMYQALLVGDGSHPALDYKMSILPPPISTQPGRPNPKVGLPPDIYYGNRSKVGENICAVLWDGDITMKLVCFNPEVRKLLTRENLAKFFICTNFGRMTSKGFGSFTVQRVNDKPVLLDRTYGEILAENYGAPACYILEGKCNGRTETNPFKVIKDFYTRMKSGLSREKVQSYLFQYFLSSPEKKIDNEKAAIKKFMNNPGSLNSGQYRYVRCLLGMGDRISYRFPVKETVSIQHKTIARFGSPLLFKIIDGKIYLVATPINPAIYGQTFRFRLGSNKQFFMLKTPDSFHMDAFLQYCCKKDDRLKRKEVKK